MWPRATWEFCTSNERSWNTDIFSNQDFENRTKTEGVIGYKHIRTYIHSFHIKQKLYFFVMVVSIKSLHSITHGIVVRKSKFYLWKKEDFKNDCKRDFKQIERDFEQDFERAFESVFESAFASAFESDFEMNYESVFGRDFAGDLER